MNSLNIISRVSPPSTPTKSRSNSLNLDPASLLAHTDDEADAAPEPAGEKESSSYEHADTMDASIPHRTAIDDSPYRQQHHQQQQQHDRHDYDGVSEDTPLLSEKKPSSGKRSSWWHSVPRSLTSSIIGSIRWVFATLASPGVYLIACFYDDQGLFSPWAQIKVLFGFRRPPKDKLAVDPEPYTSSDLDPVHASHRSPHADRPPSRRSCVAVASDSSESEDARPVPSPSLLPARQHHTRSKSANTADDLGPSRKSIRIKLNHDEGLERRRHRKTQSAVARTRASELGGEELSAHLKSPTSPIAALTKYPRAPAPPRPLIPRRQPSYLNIEPSRKPTKTLILDLDETLIHSMSKGGRMSTGHMVEVRLNAASLGMGGGGGNGGGGGGGGSQPVGQHPILYWVNKRPFCDEFLRRVVKWFNLVIFTASVQEYADPVIDWLESEKKFFSARYYRQHCTYRQGAYIKDLSAVEPDLSSVMILDNSPLSYMFHEDNSIPIQGWINDPTDSDLMHLIPFLEGLQYVHDVRSLLALRGGEDGHTAASA
ncbi:hypothetical protein GMORB2_3383 [Geosmithia morbida]|uniref:FCP1 homology domain-containing protein n=1 Tax=Geosmithia morbida TaxID=1094350 RepID=A0A9P5CZ14_9HYPO|nr:uncharacterized protein GMORB2_3383 [Geosmithia morbida]KAF4119972.1 hypothetical protein GMORB2_3383 [Geosmithia morbida]